MVLRWPKDLLRWATQSFLPLMTLCLKPTRFSKFLPTVKRATQLKIRSRTQKPHLLLTPVINA